MSLKTSRFHAWLLDQRFSDVRQLVDLAKTSNDWKQVNSFQDAWELITSDPNRTEDEKKTLMAQATIAFQSFDAAQPKATSRWTTAFGLGVFFFMAVILLILFLAIFEPTLFPDSFEDQELQPLLSRLADLETSRGLITFVFTVGVISLALIIVTANVTSNDGEGARFERSKEILTSLIAILGTILGFYFGKTEAETGTDPAPAEVAAPTTDTDAGEGTTPAAGSGGGSDAPVPDSPPAPTTD